MSIPYHWRRPLRVGKELLRTWLGSRAAYFSVFGLSSRTRALRVRRRTALVIEGFPRSANSFAVIAFESAQPEPVPLAHHLHVPAQVTRAARWGIPSLVLVRDPGVAIASLLVREPWRPAVLTIEQYLRFYTTVERLREESVLIADFQQVITDFGCVTRSLNARLGTAFGVFEHTDSNAAAVFERLDALETSDGRLEESAVARPVTSRQALRNEIVDRLEDGGRTASLLAEARALYKAVRRGTGSADG